MGGIPRKQLGEHARTTVLNTDNLFHCKLLSFFFRLFKLCSVCISLLSNALITPVQNTFPVFNANIYQDLIGPSKSNANIL